MTSPDQSSGTMRPPKPYCEWGTWFACEYGFGLFCLSAMLSPILLMALILSLSGCAPMDDGSSRYYPMMTDRKHAMMPIGIKDYDGKMIQEGDILMERGELDRYIIRWEGKKGYVMHHAFNENHKYCNTITQKEMNGYGDDQLHEGFQVEGSVYDGKHDLRGYDK